MEQLPTQCLLITRFKETVAEDTMHFHGGPDDGTCHRIPGRLSKFDPLPVRIHLK